MAPRPEDKSTIEVTPTLGRVAVSDSIGPLRTLPGSYQIRRIIALAGISNTRGRITIDSGRRVSQPQGSPDGG